MLAAGRDAGQELCGAVRSAVRAVDPEVLAFRLREVMRVDATDYLLECPVPLFYLNGTEDRLLGGAAVRDIRAIRPDVRLIDVKGPHMLLQAVPEACACEIAAAIRGCSGEEF